MGLMPLPLYVGLGLIYAAAGTAAIALAGRAAGTAPTERLLTTLFAIFFVALTQHPFPDPKASRLTVRFPLRSRTERPLASRPSSPGAPQSWGSSMP